MRSKINWTTVYGHFISDEHITLRSCSERYGINYDSLRQKASKEAWTWKKQQITRNALSLMESRTTSLIAQRNEAQAQFAKALLAKASEALRSGIVPENAKEIRQWVETGISLERQCLKMDE